MKPIIRHWRRRFTTSFILSVHSAQISYNSQNFWLADSWEMIKYYQMLYKAKASSTGRNMCTLWCCMTLWQRDYVVWQKSWYPAFCTRETVFLCVGDVVTLRENILGPSKKRGKQELKDRGCPHHLPLLSPVNATTQILLTSQEVNLCMGVSSRCYLVMQIIADHRLQQRTVVSSTWHCNVIDGQEVRLKKETEKWFVV